MVKGNAPALNFLKGCIDLKEMQRGGDITQNHFITLESGKVIGIVFEGKAFLECNGMMGKPADESVIIMDFIV